MLRKPGAYRSAPMIQRALSMLTRDEMSSWMQPVWSGVPGVSLNAGHTAPFPVEIAERLTRLFSFAGDTILDPFSGSGSAGVAAIRSGRNSISVEIEEQYFNDSAARLAAEAQRSRPTTAETIVAVSSRLDAQKLNSQPHLIEPIGDQILWA